MTTTTLSPADRIADLTDRICGLPTILAYGVLAGLLTVIESMALREQISTVELVERLERAVLSAEARVGQVAR